MKHIYGTQEASGYIDRTSFFIVINSLKAVQQVSVSSYKSHTGVREANKTFVIINVVYFIIFYSSVMCNIGLRIVATRVK